jgi:hypothetical protein
MDWVLIGTGSDLKTKVEQSLGVMFSVSGIFSIGQGKERAGQTMGAVLNMYLIMIGLIRFQVSKNGITGVIIGNTGGGWLRYLVKFTLDCSITNGEFSRIGSSSPYPY